MKYYVAQIAIKRETAKEARKKCIDLDISFTEYVRRLIKEDLEKHIIQ